MAKTVFEKLKAKYRRVKKDTGSPVIQVIVISERINLLAQHLKEHKKDNDARFGLLELLAKRRRLLAYLSKYEPKIYQKIVKDLNLKA